VGRYLLVERWEDRERGPGCTPLLIDVPTSRFDPVSGELHLWPRYGWNPALEPSDVGYFASGARVSGRGGGEASGLSRMVELPFDARDIRVTSVDRDGAIVATHEGVTLDLVAGGAHRWQSVSPGDGPRCVITMTGRLTNYGYQDRSKIVYDE
jgi:hypothetical protein